ESRTFKPFCRDMAAVLPPAAMLYGYDADETTRAVVPFYTGRTFVPLPSEADLELLARGAKGKVAVLTVDVRGSTWHSDHVRARFPHLWLSMKGDRGRRMQLFSNVPLQ